MQQNQQSAAQTSSGGPTGSFYGLGIAPKFLEVLDQLKFTVPTPIQHKAIPIALDGKDLIGIAQTGTGKTLAFGIPLLQRIARLGGKALVMLPTRELAIQVDETIQKIGKTSGVRTAIIIGGAPMGRQIQMIRRNPHVVIGTPGRIVDHLQQKTLSFHDVRVLVLDEADRMLDMGFAPQIKQILSILPRDRQTMLFSATMPDQIVQMASSYMQLPTRVEIARAGTASERVEQELFFVRRDAKNRLLDKLLTEYHGTVLVFSRTKFGAKRICHAIKDMGHTVAEIHSNRTLGQRRDALEGFKTGKYRILVATDIASRGIDVTGIELVINYDIPEHAEDYIHRIGRTGRAGRPGRAISFAMPDQRHEVRDIERLMRTVLRVSTLPELPPERARTPMPDTDREERPRRDSRAPRAPRSFGGPRPSHGSHPSRRPSHAPRTGGASRPPHHSARPDGARPHRSSGRPGGPSRFSAPHRGKRPPHRPSERQSDKEWIH